MDERARLEKKILDVEEQKRAVSVKIGSMSHTPKYDNNYSVAKFENWQAELANLSKKETGLREELAALVSSEGYVKAQGVQVATLTAKRDKVKTDWEKVRAQLVEGRYGAARAVVEGQDAVKVVGELQALEEREKTLARAYQYYSDAIQLVSR